MMEICIDKDKKDFKAVEIIGINNSEDVMTKSFEDIKNKSLIIGKSIEYLLNNKVDFKELNYFREVYIENLIQNKLASTRNSIYQD